MRQRLEDSENAGVYDPFPTCICIVIACSRTDSAMTKTNVRSNSLDNCDLGSFGFVMPHPRQAPHKSI